MITQIESSAAVILKLAILRFALTFHSAAELSTQQDAVGRVCLPTHICMNHLCVMPQPQLRCRPQQVWHAETTIRAAGHVVPDPGGLCNAGGGLVCCKPAGHLRLIGDGVIGPRAGPRGYSLW